jgi:hypothetical protein
MEIMELLLLFAGIWIASMIKEINKVVVQSLPIETLKILKQEGEKALEQLHSTEATINTKVLGMLQVLFPVFVGIFAFIVDRMVNDRMDLFLVAAVGMELVVGLSVLCFYRTISMEDVPLIGSRPASFTKQGFLKFSTSEQELEFLINRVYCIDKDIVKANNTLNQKSHHYENGYKVLIEGFAIVIFTFVLLYFHLETVGQ